MKLTYVKLQPALVYCQYASNKAALILQSSFSFDKMARLTGAIATSHL